MTVVTCHASHVAAMGGARVSASEDEGVESCHEYPSSTSIIIASTAVIFLNSPDDESSVKAACPKP